MLVITVILANPSVYRAGKYAHQIFLSGNVELLSAVGKGGRKSIGKLQLQNQVFLVEITLRLPGNLRFSGKDIPSS